VHYEEKLVRSRIEQREGTREKEKGDQLNYWLDYTTFKRCDAHSLREDIWLPGVGS
jgi:hypothetical protein